MDAFAPGTDFGKYRVVRRLATGAMADVYLAVVSQPPPGNPFVVLKRFLPPYAGSDTFLRAFVEETLVAATLDHPNVARVHDIGAADGDYFFAMEYLHGESLRRLLEQLDRRGLRLPLAHALTIAAGVAAGLHAAHQNRGTDGEPLGIVHGDVSPSNVVVTHDGGVKLVDFGVARIAAQSAVEMRAEPASDRPVDRNSDLHGLGVLLFELTTQTRLHAADRVMGGPLPAPAPGVADYPPELESIVTRALSREPDQRYASAREVQLALEEVARTRRLTLSNTSLGYWLSATFGARPEPWTAGAPGENRPVETAEHAEESTPPPSVSDAREPPRKPSPTPWWRPRSVYSVGLGLAALTGTLAVAGRTAPDPPTSIAMAKSDPEREVARRPAGRTLAVIGPQQTFAAVFARKQTEVLHCFARFAPAPGPSPKISVRFKIDVDGRVTAAEVLPPAVAQTGLGICVADVAADVWFEPQLRPLVVRIPVSVRRPRQ